MLPSRPELRVTTVPALVRVPWRLRLGEWRRRRSSVLERDLEDAFSRDIDTVFLYGAPLRGPTGPAGGPTGPAGGPTGAISPCYRAQGETLFGATGPVDPRVLLEDDDLLAVRLDGEEFFTRVHLDGTTGFLELRRVPDPRVAVETVPDTSTER